MSLPNYTVYATPIEHPSWEIRVLLADLEHGKDPYEFSCVFALIEPGVIEIRLAQEGPKPGMRQKVSAMARELGGTKEVRFTHKGRERRYPQRGGGSRRDCNRNQAD